MEGFGPPFFFHREEMMQDYKLRSDIGGRVSLGAYEPNQAERIHLTQDQPFVAEALRKKGWSESKIARELPKYQIYVPMQLMVVKEPVAAKALKVPGTLTRAAAPVMPEVRKEPKVESKTVSDPVEPPEGDSLPIDDAPVDIPLPGVIRDMSREDLEELAERHDLMSKIKGTGSNGYKKATDFKKFLIPWSDEAHKD